MLAACTDDILENNHIEILPETPVDGVVAMQMTTGPQDGRIKTAAATRGLSKWRRLEWVATITNPEVQGSDRVWSATAVAIDDNAHKAYITWHSDRQAENKAQVWGGAVDVVNISGEHEREIKISQTGTNNLLKFNNVLIYGDKLYLSATSARVGGTVARVSLDDFDGKDQVPVACIGFPGNSVNAVAPYGDKLIAVSGHDAGAYASFAPNIDANENYEPSTGIDILNDGGKVVSGFGGKYVATDEKGDTYVLYDKTDETCAHIQKVGGTNFPLETKLVSSDKYAEIYSESGGWQDFKTGKNQYDYYGKHVLAVKGGYAYVGAGKNGLRVYNLGTKNETWNNSTNTIGVYADDNYVYAATGAGLRIYEPDGKGGLELYAYEVEDYYGDSEDVPTGADSLTGRGVDNVQPAIGSDDEAYQRRHSPNFVAAHRNPIDKKIYVYIAYGQSGVRVYRFADEKPDYPPTKDFDLEVFWSTEDFPGYYAWGEVFYPDSIAKADVETKGLWGDIEHDNNQELTFGDSIYRNDASYFPTSIVRGTEIGQGKRGYVIQNYRYFDMVQYAEDANDRNQGKDGACPAPGCKALLYDKNGGLTGPYDYREDLQYHEYYFWKYLNYNESKDKEHYTAPHDYFKNNFGQTQKYKLDDCDDVVQVKWGNGWRMPTKEEWEALIEKAENYLDKHNLDKEKLWNIYTLTGRDGIEREGYMWKIDTNHGVDSLFFPCTGHYEAYNKFEQGPGDPEHYKTHYECNYWTSTVNSKRSAWSVEIDRKHTIDDVDQKITTSTERRSKGLKIRPVKEKVSLSK